jgi:ubiquinone/menaquinone biosynthesis C-methylase UbiE
MEKKKMTRTKESGTSWSQVANWYDQVLNDPDSYQSQVIWPNLKRILGEVKGQKMLDLACGQGFFSFEIAKLGASVVGVDISSELIKKAQMESEKANLGIDFQVAPADKLDFLPAGLFDTVVMVLAAQNIKELDRVFVECARVLKKSGRLILILNHPAFRVPQFSDWHFNELTKVQGRIVDKYLSEAQIEIKTHPGRENSSQTISFHRPLQVYFKWLAKNSFAVVRLEEWISHKKSQPSALRVVAEDKARKEIPMFMCLEAKLLN